MSKKQDEKDWSLDEVDRLLSRTEKPAKKDDEAVVEKFARTMRLADTVSAPAIDAETSARVSDTDDNTDISQSYKAKLRADDALGAGVGSGDILISSNLLYFWLFLLSKKRQNLSLLKSFINFFKKGVDKQKKMWYSIDIK